jgi:hypothetical protein
MGNKSKTNPIMKVYLVRDNFLSDESYSDVLKTLKEVQGSINYAEVDIKIDFEDIDETNYKQDVLSPQKIFSSIENFRNTEINKIKKDEFIVLLSELRHSENWFSMGANAIDETSRNIYVNTSIWSELLELEKVSAIVHEIMANIMQQLMFDDYADLDKHVHKEPIGCFNDFCGNIEDVKINMRTADVCEGCQNIIEKKDISRSIFIQVMETLEHVRKNMLAIQRFNRSIRDSRIEINKVGNFLAVDINNQLIKFPPREKAVYHFFLDRSLSEGLLTNDLYKHKDKLIALYKLYARPTDHDKAENIVDKIIDTGENAFSEITSKIRKELYKVFGKKNIAIYELKQGDDEKFNIELNRDNVTIDNHPRAVANQFGY